MHVIATAGHVDHGKSTLVRALTGGEPDRLEEEQRRGLSIRLGYCWTTLPGIGEVAFVDVPGHERFITTTLAGVGPVPAAMLVVAADDPWMPQAAEHLAALNALGVEHGVLVVTRADLADPGPALSRARDELARTTLAGAPSVVVSGRTGEGLDLLRDTLTEVLAGLPVPDPTADVRLWVDRRFHVRGTGTVVTGTLAAGAVRVGDTLEVGGQTDGATVRVRGLESLGRPTGTVVATARVALDLGGRAPAAVDAGAALTTPGAFEQASVLDVRLSGDGEVPEQPLLHVGAAAVPVRARPLDERHARLTLSRPLPLRVGDRAVLRDPGSRAVWGVVVLDPAPPPLRRRGAATERARLLATADGSAADELDRRGWARRSQLRRLGAVGATTTPPRGTLVAGDWWVSAGRAVQLRDALVALVGGRDPAAGGVPAPEAARSLGLPDAELLPGVVELAGGDLRLDAGRVRRSDAGLPAVLADALAALVRDLTDEPFAAPDAARLAELRLDTRGIALLAGAGHLLRVDGSVVLLPGADDLAVGRLRELPQPFTTSAARQALGTSRRVALPLLAHLDRTGRTRRGADDRRTVVAG